MKPDYPVKNKHIYPNLFLKKHVFKRARIFR